MKQSIHRYFQVGLIPGMTWPSMNNASVDEVLQILKKVAVDDYFDAVELPEFANETLVKKAFELYDVSHMTVCFACQPSLLKNGLNVNAIDEAERLKAENRLLKCIDEAEALGAKRVAFLAGRYTENTKGEAYAQLLKTTLSICAYAKAKQMIVELEVFDHDIAKKSLLGPAPLAARFAADVRMACDNFGLIIDLSHIPMTRETPEFVVRTLRPYLTHFHIGNTVCQDCSAEGYGDEHQRFGFPASQNDTHEVLRFLQVLQAEGFLCKNDPYILTFEVKPWKDEDGDLVLANAKRVLNRAWALLDEDNM